MHTLTKHKLVAMCFPRARPLFKNTKRRNITLISHCSIPGHSSRTFPYERLHAILGERYFNSGLIGWHKCQRWFPNASPKQLE